MPSALIESDEESEEEEEEEDEEEAAPATNNGSGEPEVPAAPALDPLQNPAELVQQIMARNMANSAASQPVQAASVEEVKTAAHPEVQSNEPPRPSDSSEQPAGASESGQPLQQAASPVGNAPAAAVQGRSSPEKPPEEDGTFDNATSQEPPEGAEVQQEAAQPTEAAEHNEQPKQAASQKKAPVQARSSPRAKAKKPLAASSGSGGASPANTARSSKAQATGFSANSTAKQSVPLDKFGVYEGSYLRSISKHHSMPMLSFAPKLPSQLFAVSNENPAPGTYTSLDVATGCTSKYYAQPTFGFGTGSRFPPPPPKSDVRPGPGAYPLNKFERFKYKYQPTSSFGNAVRGRANPIREDGPGPGEYDTRSNPAKDCPTFSMQGKFRKRGVLNYEDPGPGAYNPNRVLTEPTSYKAGIGTSLREDFAAKREKKIPGPGAYDVHKLNILGTDTQKSSMTSRRKRHDLSNYLSPGPGMYNQGSSFGYTSTWNKSSPCLSKQGF